MIYLNNAASSWPKAPGVAETIYGMIARPPAHPGRIVHFSDDVITDCRQKIAELLHVQEPERIIFTLNSTYALNIAISGLFKPGVHVITTVTEHNSVLRPINHLCQKYGCDVTIIGLNSEGYLDFNLFRHKLTNQPTVVIMNHASNVTGAINDVKLFFRAAKQEGATTVLDASQTLGQIPFTPGYLHADVVAFTGHKGLRGPAGTGGLYISPHTEIDQTIVGGTGIRSDLPLHPPDMPVRHEAGTPNIPGIAGLGLALAWLKENGEQFHRKQFMLTELLFNKLKKIDRVTLYNDVNKTGIVSFKVAGWNIEETGYILQESFNIHCRTGLHCAPLIHQAIGSDPEGTVRLSISGFNTEDEIETVANAIKTFA